MRELGSLGGKFLFRVLGLPEDWTLGAVRLGDKDISEVPYDVPTGGREIGGMQVVLTRRIGRVVGSVADDRGRPATGRTVVVFSEDAEHWVPYSRYVKAARPSLDGQFSIAGLPPGTYRVLARDSIEQGQMGGSRVARQRPRRWDPLRSRRGRDPDRPPGCGPLRVSLPDARAALP